jgi:hypothetical protein
MRIQITNALKFASIQVPTSSSSFFFILRKTQTDGIETSRDDLLNISNNLGIPDGVISVAGEGHGGGVGDRERKSVPPPYHSTKTTAAKGARDACLGPQEPWLK